MSIWLVRHAKAGSRQRWDGPDDLRPLTKGGHRQAEGLGLALAGEPVETVLSSSYVRCRQTVAPLAHRRRLPVLLHDALLEGAPLEALLELLSELETDSAVLCSHGDVIENLLTRLATDRVPLDGELVWPKGSAWALEVNGGHVYRGRYLPPYEP